MQDLSLGYAVCVDARAASLDKGAERSGVRGLQLDDPAISHANVSRVRGRTVEPWEEFDIPPGQVQEG